MQRNRRFQQPKPFVSGGVYNGQQNSNNQQYQQPPPQVQRNQQQFATPTRQTTRNQQIPQNQQQQQFQQSQLIQKQEDTRDEKPITPEPPAIQEENNAEYDDEMTGNDNDNDNENYIDDDENASPEKKGKIGFKKIFLIRKKSSVRAREKKIRQNRQLRKAITPKNALMALNEVKGIQLSDFVFNSIATGGFTATVTVNNTQYEGKGISKTSAKNNACEKALRDYVIAKMIHKPRSLKKNSESQAEPMDADDDQNADKDIKEPTKNAGAGEEQDDVPMLNLASFALFKLFSEWENEGYHVPEMHHTQPTPNGGASNGTSTPMEPKKLPIRSELPPNWETMHPATLLCIMRPGIQYSDLGTIGEKPNVMQKLSVKVDDKEFFGVGRSKKVARRNAAVSACNTLFGTTFADEETAANV